MRIGRFKQDASDRIRYTVDYVNWIDGNETITSVQVTGDVPADNFVADDAIVDVTGAIILFYASGGVVSRSYNVTILITTSLDQIKEDFVTIVVT